MELVDKSCASLLVQCPPPANGRIKCLNGSTTAVYEDTCTFSCDKNFHLQESRFEECLANGRWSGGNVMCVPG